MCHEKEISWSLIRAGFPCVLLFTCLTATCVWSQGGTGTDGDGGLRISGQMGISSQWYSMESDPSFLISPRRPGNLHRFVMTPVLSAGELVMPVSIIFSSRQTNVVTFQAPVQNFSQFLQNPLNTFRVTPTYKWARGIIGSQVVNYSSLTTGDAKVFGASFELTPGDWTISAFAGTLRRAIEPDSLLRIPGSYARRFRAAKIGYGKEHAFHVYLNAAVMDDDEGSIGSPLLSHSPPQGWSGFAFPLRPQKGLAGSLQVGLPIGSSIQWKNEMAVSVFTRDKLAGLVDSLSGSPIGRWRMSQPLEIQPVSP
jgi:hypothetical protein